MKRTLSLLLAGVLLCGSSAFAADTKTTALTNDASPTSDDLIMTVNSPGGTPANRKVTLENLSKGLTNNIDPDALTGDTTDDNLVDDSIIDTTVYLESEIGSILTYVEANATAFEGADATIYKEAEVGTLLTYMTANCATITGGAGLCDGSDDVGGGFDSTTVDDTTWSDSANASNIWTFDVSGTDHTMTFGDGSVAFSGDIYGEANLSIETLTVRGAGQSVLNEGLVVNEDGGSSTNDDLRVEGDAETHLIFVDSGTDTVGIGSSAPSGRFAIDGDSDEIQLYVKGHSTQSSNIMSLVNSSGTVKFGVDNSGNVTLGGTVTASGSGQSTIDEGLVVNDGSGGGAEDDFRVEGNNEPNLFVVDAGSDSIYLGDLDTNYMKVSSAGTVTFTGAAEIKPQSGLLSFGFTLETPTTADSLVPVWTPNVNITLDRVYCVATAGTATVNFTDDTNDTDSVTCVGAGAEDTSLSNASFTADETIYLEVTGIDSAPTWVNLTGDYTID